MAKGIDVLIIATEWNEFKQPDFERLYRLMNSLFIWTIVTFTIR